jgi:acid phosphatase
LGEYNSSWGFGETAKTYQRTFLPQLAERLNKMSKDYEISQEDVLAMAYICPFQINALGYSPFCDIFTENDWKNINYFRDLATYYGSG